MKLQEPATCCGPLERKYSFECPGSILVLESLPGFWRVGLGSPKQLGRSHGYDWPNSEPFAAICGCCSGRLHISSRLWGFLQFLLPLLMQSNIVYLSDVEQSSRGQYRMIPRVEYRANKFSESQKFHRSTLESFGAWGNRATLAGQ